MNKIHPYVFKPQFFWACLKTKLFGGAFFGLRQTQRKAWLVLKPRHKMGTLKKSHKRP